jgi:hypothetical protein
MTSVASVTHAIADHEARLVHEATAEDRHQGVALPRGILEHDEADEQVRPRPEQQRLQERWFVLVPEVVIGGCQSS